LEEGVRAAGIGRAVVVVNEPSRKRNLGKCPMSVEVVNWKIQFGVGEGIEPITEELEDVAGC
jgi:hypothetical protein